MGKKRIPKTRAKRIRRRLRRDELRQPIRVTGEINFSGDPSVTLISEYLHSADKLILDRCVNLNSLPKHLNVGSLHLDHCRSLKRLPEKLRVKSLFARQSGLRGMPNSVTISDTLDLSGCRHLVQLAANMTVERLHLVGCTSLVELSKRLRFSWLDMTGCTSFTDWGQGTEVIDSKNKENWSHWSRFNRAINIPRTLILNGCSRLTYLPDSIRSLNYLDVRNCVNLLTLPDTLCYVHDLEIGDSGLRSRPPNLNYERIWWHGVEIDERMAWTPEKLMINDVWDEPNLEKRRVMIDRMGYGRFFREANAELLDIDEDAGGERQLLRVQLPETDQWRREEPIVCLAVACPSTDRRYLLRVPPNIQSCHAGAAWLAGFDDPKLYDPIIET